MLSRFETSTYVKISNCFVLQLLRFQHREQLVRVRKKSCCALSRLLEHWKPAGKCPNLLHKCFSGFTLVMSQSVFWLLGQL